MTLERELKEKNLSGFKRNEPMADHTTWQVGGPADYFVTPIDLDEIAAILRLSEHYQIPLYVIGNGSNLLVLDGGIRGLVLKIGDPFCYVNKLSDGLQAGAGTAMTMLAKSALEASLTGLEFAVGIPGSVGGAVIMNAGAFGGYIGDRVSQVKLVNRQGQVELLGHEQLQFSYRSSNLVGRGVVAEVTFNLSKGDSAEIGRQMEHFLNERRRRHPSLPSCGSVFRNLPGRPAGQLIEQAGGKGLRFGGAEVSQQHANFIVNRGNATAADLLNAIRTVQKLVREKHGIELQPEVKIVGEES